MTLCCFNLAFVVCVVLYVNFIMFCLPLLVKNKGFVLRGKGVSSLDLKKKLRILFLIQFFYGRI